MNKTRLRKYANLIAKCGVNVQKGQEVIVSAELDQPEFVKMVVEECYKAGAAKVSAERVSILLAKSLALVSQWQIYNA